MAAFPTATLKKELDEHAVRIEKLEQSKEELDDHKKKHADVYDKMIINHQEILFGEKGDDGLVHDMKQLVNDVKQITNTNTQIKKNVTELTLAVVSAIIIQIIMQIFK